MDKGISRDPFSILKLGLISDCVHYQTPEGKIGTLNHIFLRQMSALFQEFKQVFICVPIINAEEGLKHKQPFDLSFYPPNLKIKFFTLPNVGGNKIKDKISLIKALPKWLNAYSWIAQNADIIYQRFPNNVNIIGLLYMRLLNKKVFATYTGTWEGYSSEPVTYRLQRWLLRNIFKGPVLVYSPTPKGVNIFSSNSPSMFNKDFDLETIFIEKKKNIIANENFTTNPIIFLTVGSLVSNKDQQFVIKVIFEILSLGYSAKLNIAGDGNDRSSLIELVKKLKMEDVVVFHGWVGVSKLKKLYREAYFVLQAPFVEGFGKVPIEAMCFGAIPILSNVTLSAHFVGNGVRGITFEKTNPQIVAKQILEISKNPNRMVQMVENGRQFVKSQSIEEWVNQIKIILTKNYNGIL